MRLGRNVDSESGHSSFSLTVRAIDGPPQNRLQVSKEMISIGIWGHLMYGEFLYDCRVVLIH